MNRASMKKQMKPGMGFGAESAAEDMMDAGMGLKEGFGADMKQDMAPAKRTVPMKRGGSNRASHRRGK